MLLVDGFSLGAWLAAFLVYGTLRSQALLRKAHRTNREQLRQLEAAHAELYRSSVQAMGYAALTERTRLARDIHDGLGHRLTSLIVQLQALRLTIGRDATKSAEMVEDLLDTARQGMQEVRMAVKEWSDDDSRLGAAALKGLVSQTEARTRLAIRYEERELLTPWPEEHGIILYRVLQEALTNILKHAEAKQAVVRVEEAGRELTLTVRDDGSYRAQEPLEPGFGLRGMKERCEAAGGRLVFRALSPHGLELETRLPLAHDDEGERYHDRTG
ncbi:sensor histidine kinase [Paenibacillus sp. CC-CFT747]|nr:sensor histidine kinase [Paenibacillus sp. CC-CFT747]